MQKFYIKKSKIHGLGIFAKKDIKKGELVGTIEGKIIPKKEAYKKYRKYYRFLHAINHSEYILNRNLTMYTNHSCTPNCGLKNTVKIIAMKNIKKDEEITIDYNTLEYDWEMKCNCGSRFCRKKVMGYKYMSQALKKKYAGFICPYLLKKSIRD